MNNNIKIICVEGVDGVGKESICKVLYDKLSKIGNTLLLSLPDYSQTSGKLIYDILHNEGYEWFDIMSPKFKSVLWTINRFEAYKKYKLDNIPNIPYEYIIMDRSYFSNLIYQASDYYTDAYNIEEDYFDEEYFFINLIDYMRSQIFSEYICTFLKIIPFKNYNIYYITNDKNTDQLKQRGEILDHYEKNEDFLNTCNYFVQYLYNNRENYEKYVIKSLPNDVVYDFYLNPLKIINSIHKETKEEIENEINRVANKIFIDILRNYSD